MDRIEKNLQQVREAICRAAQKAGRDPAAVHLVCITKYVGPREVCRLYELGERLMGESRVQEGKAKVSRLSELEDIQWHLVGHLQTNKVKSALDLFHAVHSVDSLRLARELDRRAQVLQRRVPIFLQVNVLGTSGRFGCPIETPASAGSQGKKNDEGEKELGLFALAGEISKMPALELKGLMAMAPFDADSEKARPVFRRLRELRDELNDRGLTPSPLQELSMGMSGDYPVAVEEGATYVRIGSALFR